MTDKTKQKLTKGAMVYQAMVDDILSGELAPCTKLSNEMLKERYGVGTSPLREALFKLTNDGLVVETMRCGFKVANLTVEDMEDIYQVRIFIETEAIGKAIEHGDTEWESKLLAICHRLNKFVEEQQQAEKIDEATWETLHREFHAILIAACNSPWLIKLQQLLYQQSERYRRQWMQDKNVKSKLANAQREHQEIVDAVINKDITTTKALLTDHLLFTIKQMKDIQQP